MTSLIPVEEQIDTVLALFKGMPMSLVGSAVAAKAHGRADAHDIDVFVPSQQMFIAAVQRALDTGWHFQGRTPRQWAVILRTGFSNKFNVQTLRLFNDDEIELNVSLRREYGNYLQDLSQVLEAFDFGLLAVGYNLEHVTYHDMRSYLFPGLDVNGPLPFTPKRLFALSNGYLSSYAMYRQVDRLIKYTGYGYDMSACTQTVVNALRLMAQDALDSNAEDAPANAVIFPMLADRIEAGQLDEIKSAMLAIKDQDPLTEILDRLT